MSITSVTKDGDDISFVEDGVSRKASVTGSDAIISFPITGTDRIINMYRRQSDSKLVLAYFDSNDDIQTIELNDIGDGEVHLTPKVSSSGAEGTMFYDSDDNHIYVATE